MQSKKEEKNCIIIACIPRYNNDLESSLLCLSNELMGGVGKRHLTRCMASSWTQISMRKLWQMNKL